MPRRFFQNQKDYAVVLSKRPSHGQIQVSPGKVVEGEYYAQFSIGRDARLTEVSAPDPASIVYSQTDIEITRGAVFIGKEFGGKVVLKRDPVTELFPHEEPEEEHTPLSEEDVEDVVKVVETAAAVLPAPAVEEEDEEEEEEDATYPEITEASKEQLRDWFFDLTGERPDGRWREPRLRAEILSRIPGEVGDSD